MRPVGDVVVGIDFGAEHVARLEIHEHIGAGADRLQIVRRLARLGADVILEQVFWDDHAVVADKGIGPEWRRLGKGEADGEVVDLLDRDVLVAGDRDRRGLRRSGIFPVEDDIVCRERHAVMPFDAAFQLPDHRAAVLGQSIILLARNLGSEDRHQIAVIVPSRQRLVKDPGAFLVLGADGEMRIEQGHGLPIHQLQHAAAAGLGRLVGKRGRSHRDPGLAQHHPGDRRRKACGDHSLDKGPPRQLAGLDVCNQVSKFPFFHGACSSTGAECLVALDQGNGSGQREPVKAGSGPSGHAKLQPRQGDAASAGHGSMSQKSRRSSRAFWSVPVATAAGARRYALSSACWRDECLSRRSRGPARRSASESR